MDEYQAMDRSARLASAALPDAARSMPKKHVIVPRPEWLKIRTVTRSFAFEGMEFFDLRHPIYYKLDKLWLTPESARTLVPAKLAVGESTMVKGQVLRHLIHDCHLMLGCPPWREESVKSAKLQATITQKKGDSYRLKYTGEIHLDANFQYNRSSYQGELLGWAVWNAKSKRFTHLKWVALGKRNRRELKPNETKSKVHITSVGAVFELDPMRPNDKGLAPHRWKYGYSREMKA
ncbi:MAG: hypothetical protein ACPGUY_09490, partial [Akkermansiaceae bacterium]